MRKNADMENKKKTVLLLVVLMLFCLLLLIVCSDKGRKLGNDNIKLSLRYDYLNCPFGFENDTCFYIDKELNIYESANKRPILLLGRLKKIDRTELQRYDIEAKKQEEGISIVESILENNDSVYFVDLKGHIYSKYS